MHSKNDAIDSRIDKIWKHISDKAKLSLVGALCVIGFVFAESIIGITLIYLASIAEKLRAIFEKIGRKKKNFDPEVAGEQMMRAANNKANSISKLTDKL